MVRRPPACDAASRAYSARVSAMNAGPLVVGQQRRRDPDGAAGVEHVHGLAALVVGVDLDRGVDPARRRAADQQRDVETLALHLRGDVAHLVERRGDQAGEPDDRRPFGTRRLDDLVDRHHHAEVDHLVVVALQHDAHDVLADVVDVALDGRHHDLGRRRPRAQLVGLGVHVRKEMGDRLLHHPRRLHHLGKEHPSAAEQVADDVHAGHQRTLDHVERPHRGEPCLLDVVGDEVGDAVHQRMREALLRRRARATPDRERGARSSGRGSARRAPAGVRRRRAGG